MIISNPKSVKDTVPLSSEEDVLSSNQTSENRLSCRHSAYPQEVSSRVAY